MSVAKCLVITAIFHGYLKCLHEIQNVFVVDILVFKLLNFSLKQNICSELDVGKCDRFVICVIELDTSELVELLQKSAVEHFTTYRQLEAQQLRSLATIVTTEYEALYAYKLGEYQRCLQLSTQNVQNLLYEDHMTVVVIFEVFVQLLGDEIVSLTALMLVINPECREQKSNILVSQRTLLLYLMTQCQLKLRHSVTSLAQTLNYIKHTQRKTPRVHTFEHLTLHLASCKIVTYLNNFNFE